MLCTRYWCAAKLYASAAASAPAKDLALSSHRMVVLTYRRTITFKKKGTPREFQ